MRLALLLVCSIALFGQDTKLANPVVALPPDGGGVSTFTPQLDLGMDIGTLLKRVRQFNGEELHLHTDGTSGTRGILVSQHSNGTLGALVTCQKSEGTRAAPTTVASGDQVCVAIASAYDGSAYVSPAVWQFIVDGAVSAGNVPTAFEVFTGTSGLGTLRLRIASGGNVAIGNITPSDKLHVDGAIRNKGVYPDAAATYTSGGSTTDWLNSYARNTFAESLKTCYGGTVYATCWQLLMPASDRLQLKNTASTVVMDFNQTNATTTFLGSLLHASGPTADVGDITLPWRFVYGEHGWFQSTNTSYALQLGSTVASTVDTLNLLNFGSGIGVNIQNSNTSATYALKVTSNSTSQATAFFEATGTANSYAMIASNSAGGPGAQIYGGGAFLPALQLGQSGANGRYIDFGTSGPQYWVRNGAPGGACTTGATHIHTGGAGGAVFNACEQTAWTTFAINGYAASFASASATHALTISQTSTGRGVSATVNNSGGGYAFYGTSNATSLPTAYFQQTVSTFQAALVGYNSAGGPGAQIIGGGSGYPALYLTVNNAGDPYITFGLPGTFPGIYRNSGAPSVRW